MRRRPRKDAATALRAVAVVVVLAVLAGLAVLAVDRLSPSWLRAIGLTHAGSPAGGSATASTATSGRSATRHPTRRAGGGADAASTTAALRPRTVGGHAVFVLHASTFTVRLTSPDGSCWVDVTTDTSSTPAFMGVIDGGTRTFSGVHSLVVDMGSTSGRISITSSGGHVATYAPPGAPYKIAVRTRR